MKIGLPRAGLYYLFGSFWQAFLTGLGFTVVAPRPTDKQILTAGLKIASSEICLPLKAMHGQISELAGKVDLILLPEMTGASRAGETEPTYFCPYFVGLADMMRAEFPQQKFLAPAMSVTNGQIDFAPWRQLAEQLGQAPLSQAAFNQAQKVYQTEKQKKILKEIPNQAIALVGRPYLLFDSHLNLDLFKKIEKFGYQIITEEQIKPEILKSYFPVEERSHWHLTNGEMAALRYFAGEPKVKGIIYILPFNCGPDFLLEELVIKKVRKDKPVTVIAFDEASGEAGLLTRLEAFIEMLK